MDKALAHQGMIANPLSDIYTNCHGCHPDDYQSRAETFADALGITPSSIATPTPAPRGKVLASPLVILPAPISATSTAFPLLIIIGGAVVVILFTVGIIVLITQLRS